MSNAEYIPPNIPLKAKKTKASTGHSAQRMSIYTLNASLGELQRHSLQGISTEFRICSCKVLHGQKRNYVQEWRCP